jgi:rubrerythrin
MAMGRWALDDVPWHEFDRGRVSPDLVPVVKAASMVEYNATDYRTYLQKVFRDDVRFVKAVDNWTEEERQHGVALARWAKLADPEFDFEACFKRFTDGFRPPLDVEASVRGSLSGELIARCMVETGTNSFYSALAAATDEPVLKAICRHIADDEYAHYSLFHAYLTRYLGRERLGFRERLKVALARIVESEDDELAYAYYAANNWSQPYDRRANSAAYGKRTMVFYTPSVVKGGVVMIMKAMGLPPNGLLGRAATFLACGLVRFQRVRWRWLARLSDEAPIRAGGAQPVAAAGS